MFYGVLFWAGNTDTLSSRHNGGTSLNPSISRSAVMFFSFVVSRRDVLDDVFLQRCFMGDCTEKTRIPFPITLNGM